ncbi:MAG: DUF4424 family protein [Bdellovibrionales bacterium]|nr:DUF4424 family protein [Bdellovibrionales bacterium]
MSSNGYADVYAPAQGGDLLIEGAEKLILKRQVISIESDKIFVEYDVLNDSSKDLLQKVSFPYPTQPSPADYMSQGASFEDFRVWVEGAEVSYLFDVEAPLYGGHQDGKRVDISTGLKDLGVSLNEFPDVDSMDPKLKMKLVEKNWINNVNPDGEENIGWGLDRSFYWNQKFPSKQTVHIEISYSPLLMTNSMGTMMHSWNKEEVHSLVYFSEDDPSGKKRETFPRHQSLRFELRAEQWKTGVEDLTLKVFWKSLFDVKIGKANEASVGDLIFQRKNYKAKKWIEVDYSGFAFSHGAKNQNDSIISYAEMKAYIQRKTIQRITLHSRPKSDAKVIAVIPEDQFVEILDFQGDWLKVRHANLSGYILRRDLPGELSRENK